MSTEEKKKDMTLGEAAEIMNDERRRMDTALGEVKELVAASLGLIADPVMRFEEKRLRLLTRLGYLQAAVMYLCEGASPGPLQEAIGRFAQMFYDRMTGKKCDCPACQGVDVNPEKPVREYAHEFLLQQALSDLHPDRPARVEMLGSTELPPELAQQLAAFVLRRMQAKEQERAAILPSFDPTKSN